jgi:hypothetical protein
VNEKRNQTPEESARAYLKSVKSSQNAHTKGNVKRSVLWLAMIVIIFLGMFPPWKEIRIMNGDRMEEPLGYAFLLLPPEPKNSQEGSVKIDFEQLVLQWSLVAASALALIFFTRSRVKTDTKTD